MKRRTHEEFVEEIKDLVGDEYEVLGKFTGTKNKVLFKHAYCGEEFSPTPNNFLNGTRCPSCFGTPRKTNSEFKDEVRNLVGDEYSFLEEYQGNKIRILVRHNVCGRVYKIRPNSFLSGSRCRDCAYEEIGERRAKTHEDFLMEFMLKAQDYVLEERYTRSNKKIRVTHITCGRTYEVWPYDIISGVECSHCVTKRLSKDRTKTGEEFLQEVAALVGEEYEVLGEYKGSAHRVLMKHSECGEEFSPTPNNFLRGSRCPKCTRSKGEDRVAKYLNENDVFFEEEKRIGGRLRADFYLPEYQAYIEYDGQHHYQPVEFWGGKEYLEKITTYDKVKNLYFEYLGFPYLRIPYWEFDKIEELLETFLSSIKD